MKTEKAKVSEYGLEAEDCGSKGSESVPGAPFGASRGGEGLSQRMRVIIFRSQSEKCHREGERHWGSSNKSTWSRHS